MIFIVWRMFKFFLTVKYSKIVGSGKKTGCGVIWVENHCSRAGLGNVRLAGHLRPAKHLIVAREHFLSFLIRNFG